MLSLWPAVRATIYHQFREKTAVVYLFRNWQFSWREACGWSVSDRPYWLCGRGRWWRWWGERMGLCGPTRPAATTEFHCKATRQPVVNDKQANQISNLYFLYLFICFIFIVKVMKFLSSPQGEFFSFNSKMNS